MSYTARGFGLTLALALCAMPVAAQHHAEPAAGGHDEEAGHGDSHAHPFHAVGVFIGDARLDHANELAVGLEYEARLANWVGVGVVAERMPGAHHSDGVTLALAGVHLHPYKGLRISTVAGAEFVGGDHPQRKFLFRLGGAYDIPIGHWGAVAPTFNLDFVNNERVPVFGTAFLVHF